MSYDVPYAPDDVYARLLRDHGRRVHVERDRAGIRVWRRPLWPQATTVRGFLAVSPLAGGTRVDLTIRPYLFAQAWAALGGLVFLVLGLVALGFAVAFGDARPLVAGVLALATPFLSGVWYRAEAQQVRELVEGVLGTR